MYPSTGHGYLKGKTVVWSSFSLAILFGQMIWWLLKRIEELMVRDQLEKL